MRVLQLIDSLEAGGAERVAVNYANGLLNHIEASYLCTTRAEGLLKHSLKKEVGYLYLKRTKTVDFKAIRTLSKFINTNGITIIHAHASSYFLATLIKVLNPKLKLVWHDHYGKSEFLDERPKGVLKYCSRFFNYVFSVNSKLENWAKINLKAKTVRYLPNYAVVNNTPLITKLKGEAGKRMVCLANLRPQKDHLNVLHAFKLVVAHYPDWTLHLIGKDFEDAYSKNISDFIMEAGLEQQVFLYGSCLDTSAILKRCDIGVLSSRSEGLPLALLEYGLSDLAVVATDVGECNRIIKNKVTGLLVASENHECLSEALLVFIEDVNLRTACSLGLNNQVKTYFSEDSTIDTIVNTYSLL
ncbi:glycosyltransferase [Olleya sp. HaHaR_3_96]|uniref:glycosyltransferase n=1 Tax=Olleya sp. HaHaR_3_96 TaxID=2745560 RepID=UPI001C4FEA81|nr:glycosyltransferase [Olleya sp. HaHaR_3_96]QXP61698.1 glycosyltransferase [Olleya sp. HaHaR_3_96]